MGCQKNSEIIKELIIYLEGLISSDFTDESTFLGCINRKCYEFVYQNKIQMIDGKYIGIKDINCNSIIIDNLLQNSYIEFDNNLQGILIPDKDILKRFKYQWFARLSPEQVCDSNTQLGKYFSLNL